MPEKEGAEEKTTKSVVNKKQKQMMGEEGYDVARDEGRVKPSKDKKDGTTTVSYTHLTLPTICSV